VPVLLIIGSEDALFCGPDAQGATFDCSSGTVVAQQESSYYSQDAHLEGCAVQGSGHDVSLHYTVAHPSFLVQDAASIAWSYHFVGQYGHTTNARLPSACG
jgi:hypothetical protein